MKKKIVSMLTALLLLLMIPVMPAEAAELPADTANLDQTFTTLDGGQVSSHANGKPKLLIFFKPDCPRCQNTLSSISASDWLKNGEVDVVAIECSNATIDAIRTFKTQYCFEAGEKITFCHSEQSNVFGQANAYDQLVGAASGASFWTPLIAMIDSNDNLCFVTQEQFTAEQLASTYLPKLQPSTDSQNPGSSSSSNKEDSKKDKKERNSKPVCDHVGESVVVTDATTSEDAVSAYQCVKCGEILRYEAVPNSAYATFLANTANSILRAQQGEVVINTNLWTSFNRSVFEAIKSRPDVAVTVNYSYKGDPYVLHIPAGINVDSLMDENGFGGFMYIQHVINTTN